MAESTRRRARRARSDDEDRPQAEIEESDASVDTAASEDAESEDDRAEAPLSAKELTEAARDTVEELTGFDPESVTALEWDGESWLVTVDVLELSRIPNTTDVLAAYVVQLDPNGALLGYRRRGRFVRGQVDSD